MEYIYYDREVTLDRTFLNLDLFPSFEVFLGIKSTKHYFKIA
jgi:hypothetical protein